MVGSVEYFGQNSLFKVSHIIKANKYKSVLLVTGATSFEKTGAAAFFDNLSDDVDIFRLVKKSSIVTLQEIKEGLSLIKDSYDVVIAVGGGSVLDFAKVVNLIFAQQGESIDAVLSSSRIVKKIPPLIAIPTTIGSGSEATQFAVVYIDGRKCSVNDPALLPAYTILDAGLLMNLPFSVAASSIIDALSQSVESFWACNSTPDSQSYAVDAIKIILKNVDSFASNPNDLNVMCELLRAANLAGKAINISKTTAAHAFSYPLTSHFNIPHGHAVGLFLIHIIKYNSHVSEDTCNDSRGHLYLQDVMTKLYQIFKCDSADDFSATFSDLMRKLKLSTNFWAHDITQSKIDILIDGINLERLGNNPRKFIDESEIKRFLNSIFEKESKDDFC